MQNSHDAFITQSRARGEKIGGVRLTEAIVRDIRTMYVPGEITLQNIADIYGVDIKTISRVVRRTTWRHVL